MRPPKLVALVLLPLGSAAAFVIGACVGNDPTTTPDTSGDGSTTPPVDGGGGTTDGGGGGSDSAVDAAPTAVLTLDPPLALVRRGGSAELKVKLDRKGLGGDVPITVSGLPTGVTAMVAPIAAASSETGLTISATAGADMGITPMTLSAPGVVDLVASLAVAGDPGALDESFDNDGILLDSAIANGTFWGVTVQPDGKIVAVGTNNAGWIVRRFDAAGVPDATFNTKAAAALPATGAARGVAIDPKKSRIVVVGGSGATERLTIVRLNTDGSADQAFANGGTMVATSVDHPSGSRGNGVVVRADSSILVAGTKNPLGLVERYLESGTIDNAFSSFTTPNDASFAGIVELDGGVLLAGGTDVAASPDRQIVARLLFNGSPDATFQASGTRSYGANGYNGLSFAVASNGDAILVGGDQTSPTMSITRVAASSSGNQLFTKGVNGGSGGSFYAAAGGPRDTSYAAGQITGTYDNQAQIERRESDGGLDSTFGTSGVVSFEDPGTPDGYKYIPRALTRRDGRLLIAGQRTQPTSGPPCIIRLWE